MSAGLARTAARSRVPSVLAGIALVAASALWALIDRTSDAPLRAMAWMLPAGFALIALGYAATVLAPPAGGAVLPLASPVEGRWTAVNSPTDRIPSHGTHGFGQTYAVDLLVAQEEAPSASDAGRGSFRAPGSYASFGLPVLAPADAEVVAAVSDVRDHRGRSGPLGSTWFAVEAGMRELRGARGMLGNHVVLRLADGSHFVLAHLRRGSVRVGPGGRVRTGEVIAECGNSGNSTEPHLHCQRQDIARSSAAVGLPWTIEPDGIPASGHATRG
ncbi:M23 family metallopeptidase [Clavibacter tessellarius]|uniref:M23ase beta-sheet core domain-containing protein n=1 Tax=Clavibacter tessellarius TaxID=31965 RepID=A0A225CEJ3_9MICO|nr:M23 family metallopeptidase [Clavibacter michiganensis]OQJ62165.1 hypothetical protein B5P24_03605 [Clavibacter michiganensis subsp. tessellarius]UKF34833.1 M23 family metallopeptidase [Clavibacter michiganensis subsp. tessellarius]